MPPTRAEKAQKASRTSLAQAESYAAKAHQCVQVAYYKPAL